MGGILTAPTPGQIDPKAIEAADAVVAQAVVEGKERLAEVIDRLTKAWITLRDMPAGAPEDKAREARSAVFFLAHEIKDMAALCGYDLIAEFAESLRDYIDRATLDMDARRVIVQAHVDTLAAALRAGVVGGGDAMAQQLKAAIRAAIEKYR